MATGLTRRHFLRFVVLGSGLTLAAACAPSTPPAAEKPAPAAPGAPAASAPTAAAPSTSSAQSKPAAQAPAAPKASGGGSLTMALSLAIDTMDPAQTITTMLNSPQKLVFEGLTTIDMKTEVQPSLATKWDVSADGLTWTYSLRPNIKFHDGTPFNAQAVKINYDRILNKDNNLLRRNVIDEIVEVKVVDDLTVQLRTAKPFGPMPRYTAHPGVTFHSPAAIQQYGKEIGLHPVGTGPYKLQSFPSTDRLELARHPEYWGQPAGADKMTFTTVLEDSSRIAMLQAGEVDIIVNPPPQMGDTIKGDSRLTLLTGASSRCAFISWNHLKPQYKDVRVRQAFNHAVDKATMIKSVMRGFARSYPSAWTPFTFAYNETYSYDYNPEKAKQLLAEAGWKPGPDGMLGPDGQPLTITIDSSINRFLLDAQTTEAVAGYLKAIGVNAVPKPMEFNAFMTIHRGPNAKEETDMYYLAWADPLDTSYFMQAFVSRFWAPGNNFGFYKNEEIDRLADEAIRITDTEKTKEIYKRVQKILMDDAPWIFLYSLDGLAATRANVKGVELHPTEYYFLHNASKTG